MDLSRRHFLATPLALRAQETRPLFRAEVKVVNLFASVRDPDGRIVKGLSKEDFRLAEDERPQTIGYFSPEVNVPLRLGLVVDVSGSMLRSIPAEREAILRFLRQVLHPEEDRAFLLRFDRDIELLRDLTGSRKLLEQAAGKLSRPDALGLHPRARHFHPQSRPRCGAGTSLIHDAVFLGCDEIMRKQKGRKAIIVLSDGLDGGSCTTLSGVVEAALRADTLVYTVLFLDPAVNRYVQSRGISLFHGKRVMEQIAEKTGGAFYDRNQKGGVARVFAEIEEDLRNQYSIGYVSDAPAPGYHLIRLTTKQPGFTVQTREAYYGE